MRDKREENLAVRALELACDGRLGGEVERAREYLGFLSGEGEGEDAEATCMPESGGGPLVFERHSGRGLEPRTYLVVETNDDAAANRVLETVVSWPQGWRQT